MARSHDEAAHPPFLPPGDTEVADEVADRGKSLLSRISSEVVKTFKEYFGKGPTSAKSYMVDDLLFVVMRNGLNAAEDFLLEQGEADVVRQYRQTFGNHMDRVLSEKIEALTGRKVIGFNSQILFSPDMTIEIFAFEDRGSEEPVEATASGESGEHSAAEASSDVPGSREIERRRLA